MRHTPVAAAQSRNNFQVSHGAPHRAAVSAVASRIAGGNLWVVCPLLSFYASKIGGSSSIRRDAGPHRSNRRQCQLSLRSLASVSLRVMSWCCRMILRRRKTQTMRRASPRSHSSVARRAAGCGCKPHRWRQLVGSLAPPLLPPQQNWRFFSRRRDRRAASQSTVAPFACFMSRRMRSVGACL